LPGRVKCGDTEGEIVVAHGRLPSPAPLVASAPAKGTQYAAALNFNLAFYSIYFLYFILKLS